MNENSPANTAKDWLHTATTALAHAGIASAKLDAELMLSDILSKDRGWVLAHPEQPLSSPQQQGLASALTQRQQRVPLAYIRGFQEFYGRPFTVDQRVLIPRPESEELITLLRSLPLPSDAHIIDVGTGSGCLGITAKLEIPALAVTLSDIDEHALEVASQNAANLGAEVTLRRDNLLEASPQDATFNAIIANLPYVAESWERSPETTFEPARALFARDKGLELISTLIVQAVHALSPGGFLLLEADPRQHNDLVAYAMSHGYKLQTQKDFALIFRAPVL